LRKIISEKTVI